MNPSAYRPIIRILFVVVILFFSWLMFMISWPYFAMDKHARIQFLMTKLNVYHIDYWRIGFYAHVFTSVFVLIAGATQFSAWIMKKSVKTHRVMGWIYIVVILAFSGPGAFVMGIHANGGLPARISFILLSVIWYVVTAMAFYQVRKKDYARHGEFMLRSYALTLSAITLRLYLIIINHFHFGLSPVNKYILVAWLSWIPNIIIAEILINKGFSARFLRRRMTA